MSDEKFGKFLECSFCGTHEKDVEVLVEGQDVYICDKCVISADEIVKEKPGGAHRYPNEQFLTVKKTITTH